MPATVDAARDAFARRRWADAYAGLSESGAALSGEDLERLAVAANLVGRDQESTRAWERAHTAFRREGRDDEAARCACWAAIALLLRGDIAQASGWLARAERIVADLDTECAARGLLLVPAAVEALDRADDAAVRALADEMVAIATTVGDADLLALGMLSAAQAELFHGDAALAIRLFDEIMVSVTAGDLSPTTTGIVYCAVVEGCMEVCDLRRAAEWTEALRRWCEDQQDLVPYRGQCLVHRSQVLLAHGSWSEAEGEADRACRRLADPPHPALGTAHYQLGEVHRVRGELVEAAAAYREASRFGHDLAPGLALLRLAEGDVEAAVTAVRRMVEGDVPAAGPTTLAAAVDIHLAAQDVTTARALADRLAVAAQGMDVPLVRALEAYARGCVLLAEGDAASALPALRTACREWRDLEMPYDAARARLMLAVAYREMGDGDASDLELDAARSTFAELGARVDLARAEELVAPVIARPRGLSDRECEVLRLVAAGKTNRQIARELTISEHTVARHLQNIFMKLGVTSRSAATAFAYEHGLV
jgi:DNA-binding NarL/FixJ family response regulator